MAQKTQKPEVTTTAPSTENKQPTAAEIREWYAKNQKHIENFAKAEQAARNLRDTTKTSTKLERPAKNGASFNKMQLFSIAFSLFGVTKKHPFGCHRSNTVI